MKIIILGAGQVGGTLAENLVGENNDITVVDTNGERLRTLQDKFDLRVVQGHGLIDAYCGGRCRRRRYAGCCNQFR
ncbi:NAD-binding protein [Escherichia coli]